MTGSRGPICPYCRYDLSGSFAAAQRAWPLEITCSECGNSLDSRQLWQTLRIEGWSFARAPRPTFRPWLLTSLAFLWPWQFWATVHWMPVRPARRSLLFAASWLFIMAATLHVLVAATALLVDWSITGIPMPLNEAGMLALFPFRMVANYPRPFGGLILCPAMAGLLPQTMMVAAMLLVTWIRRDSEGARHVLVALCFALPLTGITVAMGSLALFGLLLTMILGPDLGLPVVIPSIMIVLALVVGYPLALWTWWCAVGTYLRISPGYLLVVMGIAWFMTFVIVEAVLLWSHLLF